MIYDKFKGVIENPEIKTIEVTSEDFKHLLEDPNTCFGPMKPTPPVSKEISETRFKEVKTHPFRRQMLLEYERREVHYDYQDKEYLEQMREYKTKEKKVNELYYYGKRVVLKDDSKITI